MKHAALPRHFGALRFPFLLFVLWLCVAADSHRGWAFDHSYALYGDSVLLMAVDGDGVNYDALVANPAPLQRFLDSCAAVPFARYQSWNPAEQQAFLINLYNAAVLKLVVDRWPLAGIREVGSLLTSAWTLPFIELFERSVSLGNIEHDVLRPQFKDPRAHFALSTAARSGPRLQPRPYLPESLDSQLRHAAAEFITARPAANRYAGGTLYLSPLFKWYLHDFGKLTGLLRFLQPYYPDISEKTPIVYSDFDWSLDKK